MKLLTKIAFTSLAIALIGCGGAGSLSNPQFAAPTAIQMPDAYTAIVGVSPNGHLIGSSSHVVSGIAIVKAYSWNSPTSAPILLTDYSGNTTYPVAVNDSGEIVGNGLGPTAIVWVSSGSAPAALAPPLGLPETVATGINSSGKIIGYSGNGIDPYAVTVWDGSSSGRTSIADFQWTTATFVMESGTIYGTGNPNLTGVRPAIWSDQTVRGQFMPDGEGGNSLGRICAVNPRTGAALTTGLGGPAITGPLLWTYPSLSVTHLPTTFAPTGISDDGMISYSTFPGAISSQAMIASSPTTEPVLMTSLIPPGTGWNLKEANFQLADGSIIGRGAQTIGGVTNEGWYYAKRIH